MQAWVWPTTPAKPGGQGLLACWSESEHRLRFRPGRRRPPAARARPRRHRRPGNAPAEPLARWRWAFVAATYDPASGTVSLYQASAEPYALAGLAAFTSERVTLSGSRSALPPPEDLLLAARALAARPDGRRQVARRLQRQDRPPAAVRPGARRTTELEDLRQGTPTPTPTGCWPPGTSPPTSTRAPSRDGLDERPRRPDRQPAHPRGDRPHLVGPRASLDRRRPTVRRHPLSRRRPRRRRLADRTSS